MKYLKNRPLAVAARPGVPLRSDLLDSPALQRIYHFHVPHPGPFFVTPKNRDLAYTKGMAFLVDQSYLPATLTARPMSDDEFTRLCAEHPDLSFEMTGEGDLIVMPPTYSLTGARNSEIGAQLRGWARQDGRGVVCDSSTGFVLPNGARRSPDVAWIRKDRVRQLDPESLERYWRLCPDFVIELRSKSDRLPNLRDKMREWLANGAELGWLIDPEARSIEVYRPDREPEILTGAKTAAGEGPVAGFVLDLGPVWNPLGV